MSKGNSFIENRLYGVEDKGTIQFYQLSKEIINHPEYRELSFGAKILYSLLFDRLQLSMLNNWQDDQGHFFLQFKVKPSQGDLRAYHEKPQSERSLTEVMNANAKTVGKYKKELKDAELLLEVKEGLGKVSRLYLAKSETEDISSKTPTKSSPAEDLPPQTTRKAPLREGVMPSRTTPELPLGEGIMPPQRGRVLPPNDTDLSNTDSNKLMCSEINRSIPAEEEDKGKEEKHNEKKQERKTGMDRRSLHRTPDEVHQTLMKTYGKELLSEGIAIIETKPVSKYGYEKYLAKILEDLSGRQKSQQLFKTSPKSPASPRAQPAYHLKYSRYKNMSEEAMNAKLKQKSDAIMERNRALLYNSPLPSVLNCGG